MSGIADALSEIKNLPDDALRRELASPTGALPGYLVLGEMHERKSLRSGGGSSKPKSLADDYIGDLSQYAPPRPQAASSSPAAGGAMPPPAAGGISSLSPPTRGFAGGGIVGLAGGGRVGGIEEYIRQSAVRHGVDPDIAVRVAQSEGGLNDIVRQSDYVKDGVREQSYGPFQLYLGGGLGNRALEAGIDPRNPEHGYRAIDFALAEAKNKGWGQWYGAAKAGIGDWQGINGKGGASYPNSEGLPASTQSGVEASDPSAAPVEPVDAAAATEDGGLGGGIGEYMLMSQLLGGGQQAAPAPPPSAPQQPVRPFNPGDFIQDPDFIRRRMAGYA